MKRRLPSFWVALAAVFLLATALPGFCLYWDGAGRLALPHERVVAPFDMNLATVEEWQQVPGIGPVLAGRIVAMREQRGGFSAPDELLKVTGIGEKRLAVIRHFLLPLAEPGQAK